MGLLVFRKEYKTIYYVIDQQVMDFLSSVLERFKILTQFKAAKNGLDKAHFLLLDETLREMKEIEERLARYNAESHLTEK